MAGARYRLAEKGIRARLARARSTLVPMLRGMTYRRTAITGLAFTFAVTLLLVTAAPSPAPVAPRNCGMMTVEGQRYQVKADQIRCRTAKTRTRRYLRDGDRPSGYRCRNYSSGTALKFRCWRRQRVFFAIRR
jgi:hypothetical protein